MTEPREEPALLAGPSYTPQMGNGVPCSGGRLVCLSPAAGLWWSRSHEQGRGVSRQGGLVIPRKLEVCGVPRWRRGGSRRLGNVGTSGENRMSLDQSGLARGSA